MVDTYDAKFQDPAAILRGSARDAASQPKLKLVLFDIDGTLLSSGMFTKCLGKIIEKEFGSAVNTESLKNRAKTGRTVRSELMIIAGEAGIPEGSQKEFVEKILASATTEFKIELSKSPLKLLDGVAELIERLSKREDTVLGIVTNNIREMMLLKLSSVDLLEMFSRYGMMFPGDSTGHKSGLIKSAADHAVEKFGSRLDRKDIFYIGDQVSDVLGAKLSGVVAVGVATGRSSFGELAAAGAFAVFHNLSDTNAAMGVIYGPRRQTARKKVSL